MYTYVHVHNYMPYKNACVHTNAHLITQRQYSTKATTITRRYLDAYTCSCFNSIYSPLWTGGNGCGLASLCSCSHLGVLVCVVPCLWQHLYLIHAELAIYIKFSDRNEIWAQDLYHLSALVEVAKSLVFLNIIGHGKVTYQKPRLKSMAHAVHSCSAAYIAMY